MARSTRASLGEGTGERRAGVARHTQPRRVGSRGDIVELKQTKIIIIMSYDVGKTILMMTYQILKVFYVVENLDKRPKTFFYPLNLLNFV